MEPKFTRQQLPSGKMIVRQFGADGSLIEETHGHGGLDIALSYRFRNGAKVEETYFAKNKMVSRRTYEKARVAYPDMPVADNALQDGGAELLRAAAKEHRERNAAAKRHCPNPDDAGKLDAFCTMLMQKGKTEDAIPWVQAKMHTLGERSWSSSKRLVERLSSLGCVRICACEIDVYEDGLENTGNLVVELPTDAETRRKILRAIHRLASEVGYSGDFDDGQRYAYLKLD